MSFEKKEDQRRIAKYLAAKAIGGRDVTITLSEAQWDHLGILAAQSNIDRELFVMHALTSYILLESMADCAEKTALFRYLYRVAMGSVKVDEHEVEA